MNEQLHSNLNERVKNANLELAALKNMAEDGDTDGTLAKEISAREMVRPVDISSLGEKVVEQPAVENIRATHVRYRLQGESDPRPFQGEIFKDDILVESYQKEYVSLPDGRIVASASESVYGDGVKGRTQMDYDNEGRVTKVSDVLDGKTMHELTIDYDEQGDLRSVHWQGQDADGSTWQEHAVPSGDEQVEWTKSETGVDGKITKYSGVALQEQYIAHKQKYAPFATRSRGDRLAPRRIDT